MSVPTQSIFDTRRHQMFPTLEPAEVERVRRVWGGDEAWRGEGARKRADALRLQDAACAVCSGTRASPRSPRAEPVQRRPV
jgi:hypothetical protein